MANTFEYLLDKIAQAPFIEEPFRHIEIQDFLSPEHFRELVSSPQIDLAGCKNTAELLERLKANGYAVIPFPGCVNSEKDYLAWYEGRTNKSFHEATEGFGIVYRLTDFRHQLAAELDAFFLSDGLKNLLTQKFGIERPVEVDAGIQKYLHGYEISPHPDIRRKALTWMLNINPGENTEDADFHTHYLRLKDRWRFVGEFWRGNQDFDRDWLPWDWCETVKRQRANNSIVFFSPSDDTIHAVKADYDHLKTQRTQFYGNLWYDLQPLPKADFKYFDIASTHQRATSGTLLQRVKKSPAYQVLKSTGLPGAVRAMQALRRPSGENVRKVKF
jgi:hypothetical protein